MSWSTFLLASLIGWGIGWGLGVRSKKRPTKAQGYNIDAALKRQRTARKAIGTEHALLPPEKYEDRPEVA